MQRRADFSHFLSSSTSLTINRYFRLMALATVELLFNIPLSTYGLYLNITGRPMYPWKSWADTHFDWYIIDTYPAILWRASTTTTVNFELSRWALIFCALVFFGFFGFAEEARKNYRQIYWTIAKRFGVLPPPPSSSSGSKALARYVAISSSHFTVPLIDLSLASKNILHPIPVERFLFLFLVPYNSLQPNTIRSLRLRIEPVSQKANTQDLLIRLSSTPIRRPST